MTARWYSPVTGEYQPAVAPSVPLQFTPPASGDWVLVLEKGDI